MHLHQLPEIPFWRSTEHRGGRAIVSISKRDHSLYDDCIDSRREFLWDLLEELERFGALWLTGGREKFFTIFST
jgi:hypothetical protein